MAAKKSIGDAGKEKARDVEQVVPAAETAQQRIAERAYRFYMDRGAEDGYALEDWLRAERDVLGEES